MKKYGKALVTALPEATTQLLMSLCTDYKPKKTDGGGARSTVASVGSKIARANPEDFIHCYVNHTLHLKLFLTFVTMDKNLTATPISTLVWDTLLELHLRSDTPEMMSLKVTSEGTMIPCDDLPNYEANIMKLLRDSRAKYNDAHALVLVQMLNFKVGQLFLYDKLRMYHMVIQHHMESDDKASILSVCIEKGEKDPNLLIQVLQYFCRDGKYCEKEVVELLRFADKKNLLSPLLLVHILSKNKEIKFKIIQDYIVSRLKKERNQIDEDSEEGNKLEAESSKMDEEISKLESNLTVFQNTKCSQCETRLDLPAVHFYCKHSYHKHCLPDGEEECRKCHDQNKHFLDVKKSLQSKSSQHEQFYGEIDKANPGEGFSKISEYLGKGFFDLGSRE